MTKLFFMLFTVAQIGCKDTSNIGDSTATVGGDTTSIENIIHKVRQQTLLCLDTTIGNDSKRLLRFHSKLDSSTYQTLQNWIFHNERKIQSSDNEVLNLLIKSHVDSLLLSKYDTILLPNASNSNRVTQIHFNGFAFNSDTTRIATVVGVYFGDEGERITGWKEFFVFSRHRSSFTISKRGIVTEY